MHDTRRRYATGRSLIAKAAILLAVLLAFVVTVTALPQIAWADDVADEADHLFTLGAERYQDKDYKGALQHFLASNRLVRNRNVMFNIARTYEHLHQYADAYRYFQRALEGETDNAVKTRIRESLQRIAPSIALLKVETEPPGALVYLNRKDLGDRGTAPQTLALVPGTYTVIAELAGYDEATSAPVEVRTGSEKTVTLKLTRVVGTVRVSGADGATIRIDADDAPVVCTAPCDVPATPGQHTLIFTKQGARATRLGVLVKANTVTNLRADLEAETGSLVVNADERDAVIEIDGKTQGFTPAVLAVPVGTHEVRVTLRGFKPVERRVEMKANAQTQLDLQLVGNDSVEAASRVAEAVEDAPASVTLVSSPELRGMRYPTLAEALRGVRGVFVSDDRGYKSLGFRGFGRPGDYGNRVLVLIDGMPTNDNWVWSSYVGYDLRTDLDDVERIEVVRGPGSILYGTGAFSGVVNLVMAGNDTPDGREVGVSVADDGVARARARVTQHFSKDSGIWTSVAAGRAAGRDIFVPEYVPDGPPSVNGTARGLDGFRVGTVSGRVWWKALSAQWSLNHHDKQLPGGQFNTTFGDGRTRQADTRGFLELKLEPKLGEQFESLTRAYANYYGYRAAFARSPGDGGVERDTYDGKWVGAEQRVLEFALVTDKPGPVQQAVRVEGVPDPHPVAECEADLGAALAQVGTVLRQLGFAHAVLGAHVLGSVGALGGHRRIEFKGLEVQLDVDLGADAFERALQRVQADSTPGAGHVGYEIDLHRQVLILVAEVVSACAPVSGPSGRAGRRPSGSSRARSARSPRPGTPRAAAPGTSASGLRSACGPSSAAAAACRGRGTTAPLRPGWRWRKRSSPARSAGWQCSAARGRV